MGMSLGGKRRGGLSAEINVTPMVDVMLVLLVIFMVTAPVLHEGFHVDLPQASETITIPVGETHPVTITKSGEVLRPGATSIKECYGSLRDLESDLMAWKSRDTKGATESPIVVIIADREAKYERVIQVWNTALAAGITRVSFQLAPGSVSP